MAPMAVSVEQARHTEDLFHIALRQSETHLVCFSCSAESATEALSLALHSVPRVSVCLACPGERAIEAISLALHSVSHRLKSM